MPIQIQNLSKINVSARSIVPFIATFKNIQFTPYGAANPAPIGIRVIGTNNYIV